LAGCTSLFAGKPRSNGPGKRGNPVGAIGGYDGREAVYREDCYRRLREQVRSHIV
jgi:hypothetical protein